MFENPIILLGHFTESFLIAVLGGILFNVASRNHYIKFGIINGLCVYLIRTLVLSFLGLPFGINTVISFIASIIVFKYIFESKWMLSALMSTIGFFTVIISEILLAENTLNILNTTFQQMLSNPLLHLEFIIINDIPMFVVICIVALVKKTLSRKEISNEREYC